jgi:ppGpp synthetase/RelA/SpoT-type nucleotidyltranferase
MSLPISKSQIDRLGQRLIAGESPADEDLALLEDVLIAYAGVVSQARQILDVLENDGFRDVSITGRAKTTQTTLEKLVRNRSRLSSIEDLAGVRIVADITLSEQDALAERVCELFGGTDSCRLIDRRADPRSGYRAVHVVAKLDGMPLEIQVRTRCQDAWANFYEATADAFGRGIRYGEPARRTSDAELDAMITRLVAWIIRRSDSLYEEERINDVLPIEKRQSLNILSDGLAEMTQDMRKLRGRLRLLTRRDL